MKLILIMISAAFFLASLAAAQQGPDGLLFNVPYLCNDGNTYVVHRCEKGPKFEACFYQAEGESERYNTRDAVVYQMTKMCKIKAPPVAPATAQQSAAAQTSRQPPPSTLVPTASGRIAAGLNPAYLNDLPSVETVKKLIQGQNPTNDPTDTMERQVAVFNLLNSRIQHHIAADRTRNRSTPDEDKVTYAYNLAAYELEQGYKKTHTKEEADAFFRRHGQYEMDSAIEKDIDTKLLSAAAVAENRQNDQSALQQLQAHNQAIIRQNEEAKARASAAGSEMSSGMSNDPGAQTIRRCLELGGDSLSCLGKGIGDSFKNLIGIDFDALKPPSRTGLTIAGVWRGDNKLQLAFVDEGVTITGCGSLLPTPHNYTVTRRGDTMLVEVSNEPRPFAVALGPDGNIAGPGPFDITGTIITGYRHYTEYTRRLSDNQIIGERPVEEPIYGSKVERCVVGALHSTGPVFGGSTMELFSALLGGSASNDKQKTFPSGPRLVGVYAGPGGLSIQFAPEGVVMDCGAAHVARTYRVENTASALRVAIDNGGTPIALTLQADGSLAGSGTAEVVGRLVSGKSPSGDLAFRPTHASCPIGTLTPRTQKSSSIAGN